jgi:AmmeMemoRadiSam system protein B
MARVPAVADSFYPANPEQLRSAMNMLIPAVPADEQQTALALVMPHAGYVYSGATAGATISRVRVRVPETALILGPNHRARGAALALGLDDWQMPLGTVPINQQLAEAIMRQSAHIVADSQAHLGEHSIEVLIPFLQQVQPALQMVPLTVSYVPYDICQIVARDLAAVIRAYKQPVLLLASTDMNHYESRDQTAIKDRLAIERILALDPQGLYATVLGNKITMCGIIPTTITLLTAMELGATRADLVRYTDSGEASGDTSRVVGYAGLIIS